MFYKNNFELVSERSLIPEDKVIVVNYMDIGIKFILYTINDLFYLCYM